MALILIMGLPGAGKTSLAKNLAEELKAMRFSFDDLIGRSVEDFDAHASRKYFEQSVRMFALDPANATRMIILDDNFYLRSMRRPFERIARAAGRPFAVFYLQCSVQVALERNAGRPKEDSVSSETIQKMDVAMDVTEDVLLFTGLESLIKHISSFKIPLSKTVVEEQCQAVAKPSYTHTMEMTLRSLVSALVRDGYSGSKLAKAKKLLFSQLKESNDVDLSLLREKLISLL